MMTIFLLGSVPESAARGTLLYLTRLGGTELCQQHCHSLHAPCIHTDREEESRVTSESDE
jgi:hypothetical protein